SSPLSANCDIENLEFGIWNLECWARIPNSNFPIPNCAVSVVRRRLEVLPQEVAPEVAVEVPPDRVNVVAVVLRVVVFDEERRPLNAVVVLLPALGLARPRERDLADACLLQPL